ncbi:MAG TPA: BTAD domain-containing putative transcriptional regulator, partial [Longimicrobiales bacterium]|nr:BTAD domain-containing putative transcriptional regulator [Longimicrobiales bacterium]
MAIRIHTLGTQRVEQDGRVLDRLPAQRVRLGVLVFIAVEREVSRDRVLGMFWADRPPERARHALSQTLYELRQELGDDVVRTVGETLAIGHHVAVDVHDFAEAVEAEDYRAALSLYGGRFLAGANLSGSRELEGWIDGQESRIHRLHRKARRGAISAALEAGAAGEALSLAREWAETDPLDDEAQHRVIELMADEGDRAGALRQYERYARLMEEELELEPLDETRELVEQIRASDAGAPPLGTTEPRPESGPRSGPEPRSEPKPSPGPEPRPEPVPAPRAERGREAHQTTSPSRIDRALEVPERRPVAARRTGWAAAVLILVLGAGGLWFVLGGWSSSSDRQGLDPRRIAVLFFDDHSPSQELGPAAAGFTEALIHELDQVSGLEILS